MRHTTFVIAMLAATLWTWRAPAEVLRQFEFQGRLTNAQGTPLTGNHAVRITLSEETGDGNQVVRRQCHSETHEQVQVSSGHFKVTVGRAPGGIPTACTFAWPTVAEIAVRDPNGVFQALSPATRISPAAHALVAFGLAAPDRVIHTVGNGPGQIPLSNGIRNQGLNAEKVGGKTLGELFPSSTMVYRCGTELHMRQPGLQSFACPDGKSTPIMAGHLAVP
jgi:hypothetical protein